MFLTDYPWYMAAGCLLLGAMYAAVMYAIGPRQGLAKWLRWLLGLLRTAAVGTIALLLLSPATRRTHTEAVRPQVLIAQDASLSVAAGIDSAYRCPLIDHQHAGYDILLETFGDSTATDIGTLLSHHRTDPLAAVVLITDGLHNRGPSPMAAAQTYGIPIHCIGLGDTTPRRDAALMSLRANRIAMQGSTIAVEVTATARLLSGHKSLLTVTDSAGRQLHRQEILYDGDLFSQTFALQLPAETAGLQRFAMRLQPVEGELTEANNTVAFYVDVIDTRRRVAIFAQAPHPDLATLRAAINANPNYEADIIYAADAERPGWKPQEEYSLAVLHNLPSEQHPSVAFAEGLPRIYIIGLQTSLPRFNALHTGLEINARTQRTSEVTASVRTDFSLFTLPTSDGEVIEALPPLSAPFGEGRTSASMQTLLSARVGSITTREPLLCATAQAKERTAVLWGEGLWRWRLADYEAHASHEVVDRLIAQLVAFTSLQATRGRLQVEAERSYPQGLPVELRAVLYNEAFETVNDREVRLTLGSTALPHETAEREYLFHRQGTGYALTLPALEEGLYRYRATSGDLTAEGTFAIEALNLEQRTLQADHALLRALAATTGGVFAPAGQEAAIADALANLRPTLFHSRRLSPWLQSPWLLCLIVLLLGAEWVLRKYHGTI